MDSSYCLEAISQAIGQLAFVSDDRLPSDASERIDGCMQGHGADHIGRAGFLPIRRSCPDHLVEADQVHRSAPGQEGIADFEEIPWSDQRARPEGGIELVTTEGEEVGGGRQRPVGRQLRGIDYHPHPPFMGRFDNGLERRQPPRHVGCSRQRQQGRRSPITIESGADVIDGEGSLGRALDVSPGGYPTPREQVGVVLDNGGHHDVGRVELQTVGQMIDGLGGVPAENGNIRAVRDSSGELEHRPPCPLIGGSGIPRPEAGSPVHARVPRDELRHSGGCIGMGLGRSSLIQFHCSPVDAIEAGHLLADADQVGQGDSGTVGSPSIMARGRLHVATLRGTLAPRVRSQSWRPRPLRVLCMNITPTR